MEMTLAAAIEVVLAAPPSNVVPAADHHQHLFSPALAELLSTPERTFPPLTAKDLIAHLDAAAIERLGWLPGRPSIRIASARSAG